MIKKLLVGIIALGFLFKSFSAQAQSEIEDIFQAGPNDSEKLLKAYLNPMFKGLGLGLNSSWNHSAKTKKPFGFDFRFSGIIARIPTKDLSFNIAELGLESIRPTNPLQAESPTVFGSKSEGPELELYHPAYNNPSPFKFRLPQGTGLRNVPVPQIQFSMGLFNHLDVSLRYVPEVNIEDGNFSLLGLGGKLEISPLFFNKELEHYPIEMAIAFGYSTLRFNLPLKFTNQTTQDQEIISKFHGYNTEFILSKRIGFFAPFASISYQRAFSYLDANGTFEYNIPASSTNSETTKIYVNPISFRQKDIQGLFPTMGFQMYLGPLKVFAAYSFATYHYANAGIALGTNK